MSRRLFNGSLTNISADKLTEFHGRVVSSLDMTEARLRCNNSEERLRAKEKPLHVGGKSPTSQPQARTPKNHERVVNQTRVQKPANKKGVGLQ